ncbi:MAG: hypothetical protein JNL11_13415 [Bdellovibrionaceae bacterium]|nr:hypothetical protein [Pseudobdellovibrionaceae bacterium]
MKRVLFGIFVFIEILILWPMDYAFGFSSLDGLQLRIQGQFNKTNPLFGYLVGPGTEKLDKPVLRPFASDGCSQSPNEILGYDFVDCCVLHDLAYWLGGTSQEKEQSDRALQMCIAEKANSVVARIYYEGVSVGGAARGPNTFRWGYGWDYRRSYSPITSEERLQAERMYGKDLYKLKEQIGRRQYVINLELFTVDYLNVNRTSADKLVYYFLQNNLKRHDVVTFASKMTIKNSNWWYQVRLQSCGSKNIYLNLNSALAWMNSAFYGLDIDTAPWSELQKYIVEVRDPGGCLK